MTQGMKMPQAKIDVSMFEGSEMYPENQTTRRIEEKLAESLSPVCGLEAATSHEQRQAIYDSSVSNSRQAFIELYGDPFGCEPAKPLETLQPVVPVPELFAI